MHVVRSRLLRPISRTDCYQGRILSEQYWCCYSFLLYFFFFSLALLTGLDRRVLYVATFCCICDLQLSWFLRWVRGVNFHDDY